MEFERLGVFTYSAEEDTPAADFDDRIEEDVKSDRRNKNLSELQQEISLGKSEQMVGKELLVLIEGKVVDENAYIGRTYIWMHQM